MGTANETAMNIHRYYMQLQMAAQQILWLSGYSLPEMSSSVTK